jgi:hypothetical protein
MPCYSALSLLVAALISAPNASGAEPAANPPSLNATRRWGPDPRDLVGGERPSRRSTLDVVDLFVAKQLALLLAPPLPGELSPSVDVSFSPFSALSLAVGGRF